MKISVQKLRQVIREELLREINAQGLPPAARHFSEVPSLQKGYNDLARTYKNVLVMQGIVHNNANAAQMTNQQLDQLAAQYDQAANAAAQKFQQALSEFLDDSFVEDLRGLSRGNRARPEPQNAVPQSQASPVSASAPTQVAPTVRPPSAA